MAKILIILLMTVASLTSCEGTPSSAVPPVADIPQNKNLEFEINGEHFDFSNKENTYFLGNISEKTEMPITTVVTIRNSGKEATRINYSLGYSYCMPDIEIPENPVLEPGEAKDIKITFDIPKDKGFDEQRLLSMSFFEEKSSKSLQFAAKNDSVPVVGLSLKNKERYISCQSGHLMDQRILSVTDFKARNSTLIQIHYDFADSDIIYMIDGIDLGNADSSFGTPYIDGEFINIPFAPKTTGLKTAEVDMSVLSSNGDMFKRSFEVRVDVSDIDERFFAYDEAHYSYGSRTMDRAYWIGSKPDGGSYIVGDSDNVPMLMELDASGEFASSGTLEGTLPVHEILDGWIIPNNKIGLLNRNSRGDVDLYDIDLVDFCVSVRAQGLKGYIGQTEDNAVFYRGYCLEIIDKASGDSVETLPITKGSVIKGGCVVSDDEIILYDNRNDLAVFRRNDGGWKEHRIPLGLSYPITEISKRKNYMYIIGNAVAPGSKTGREVTWISIYDMTLPANDNEPEVVVFNSVYENMQVTDGMIYMSDYERQLDVVYDLEKGKLFPFADLSAFERSSFYVPKIMGDHMYYAGTGTNLVSPISGYDWLIKKIPLK